MHHGTPGSGAALRAHVELAREQGIRLIGYDRPGYGGSSRDEAGRSRTPPRTRRDRRRARARALRQLGDLRWRPARPRLRRALRRAPRGGGEPGRGRALRRRRPRLARGHGRGESRRVRQGARGRGGAPRLPRARGRRVLGASRRTWSRDGDAARRRGPRRADAARSPSTCSSAMRTLSRPGIDGWLDDDLAFLVRGASTSSAIDRPTLLLHGERRPVRAGVARRAGSPRGSPASRRGSAPATAT